MNYNALMVKSGFFHLTYKGGNIQMKSNQPSRTYKILYRNIIEELLFQICNKNANYCIQHKIGGDEFHIAIWKTFEKYRKKALLNMESNRLDRHKLASCICGSIVEVRPLVGFNGAKIKKNSNSIFNFKIHII